MQVKAQNIYVVRATNEFYNIVDFGTASQVSVLNAENLIAYCSFDRTIRIVTRIKNPDPLNPLTVVSRIIPISKELINSRGNGYINTFVLFKKIILLKSYDTIWMASPHSGQVVELCKSNFNMANPAAESLKVVLAKGGVVAFTYEDDFGPEADSNRSVRTTATKRVML